MLIYKTRMLLCKKCVSSLLKYRVVGMMFIAWIVKYENSNNFMYSNWSTDVPAFYFIDFAAFMSI
jgi:hypothetical protein